ncbi:MAG: lauroyl acyltransferase, partial [Planctomycetes bacterium]|nr:lauroyl acyltransferase [Planctomycetota bacterium]
VPIFLVREKDRYKIIALPELELVQTGDKNRDIHACVRQFNHAVETIVRRYPDQWFWVHQRWKTKPYSDWPRT